ncbi:anhydro-N-acetylmuramic acid kinase [Candidatus Pelagibacter sp. Uisw_134_02]|jgi:anhydro-N-acetylmuramic acid kinase|uniref:anhydro-N-acetylmuramic acid kinase n=1 Tax=Candidatus Pelagibacter sp. Uisw_134_02 TaxID=3230990 RepID=UPI0039ED6407
MKKNYTALGLMSGTSMDGVDASTVFSDGNTGIITSIKNQYFEYDKDLYQKLTNLRDKISNSKDLKNLFEDLNSIEKKITLFHAKIVNEMIQSHPKFEIDIVGFHGQTIFHNAEEKISVQLGDGKLLSQLTKKKVVYNFRQNDLKNGGQGAPLTPIFHQNLVRNINLEWWPVVVLNIGGISNATSISRVYPSDLTDDNKDNKLFAEDIGPGNCLIDEWIRKNSKYRYDKDGLIAKSGKVNELIFNQAVENFLYLGSTKNKSLDVKDFDISFVRGLSLEDGAATLTHFTAKLIGSGLINFMLKCYAPKMEILSNATCLVCGGGRKNKLLIDILKKNLNVKELVLIDGYGIDGDFIESQAFAYLAIRSYLSLPISYPSTTDCKKPTIGGVIVENF